MNNVYDISRAERRYDEASRWIALLDKQLLPDEAIALQEWMAENPKNEAVLLEMARLWDKMDALGRLSSLFQPPVENKRGVTGAMGLGFAAMLLLVAITFGLLWHLDRPQFQPLPTEYVYQTDIGKRSDVSLPDGTKLQLNTDSRILVQYTTRQRLLTLERGEVYVNVAKDESRPLSVIAEDRLIQAVGTEFNVKITTEQLIELVVLEGKVRIGVRKKDDLHSDSSSPGELDESSPFLVARQAIMLGDSSQAVNEVSSEEIEVNLSWREGHLIFRGESLEEAVREIERYTSVEFVFLDEDLKNIRVAGLFKTGDVEGLLATLRENFDIVYQYTESKKVLLGAR